MQIVTLSQLSLAGYTSTTSGTIISDNLTSGTNWAVQSGSATYSGSGATFTANGTFLVDNAATTKPATGIPIIAQATFTTPASGVPLNMKVSLFQDTNNFYELRWQNDNNLVLYKTIAGTTTAPSASGGTPTESASTAYTFSLQLDSSGNLTANLYSGTGTGGSLLKSLTATDTALTGPFKLGVGGDLNVVATGGKLTGPVTTPLSPSGIAEAKIPLWWASGQYNGGGSATSAGAVFLQDGSGGSTTVGTSQEKLFTLSSSWSPSQKFAYEATTYSNNASYTAYKALWDFTTGTIVSGSQVSTTATTATVLRSGQFTLNPSHQYGITTWSSSSSGYAMNVDDSLIIFPS